MGLIELTGMQFYAFHGHFEAERIVGNNFLVDLEFRVNCTKASKSDDLKDTVDYQEVYNIVKKEMKIPSRLLEHVAKRILDSLFQTFVEIQKAKIKISKLNPPMGGQIGRVGVTLSRKGQ